MSVRFWELRRHRPLAVGVTARESVLEARTKLPFSGPVKLHST